MRTRRTVIDGILLSPSCVSVTAAVRHGGGGDLPITLTQHIKRAQPPTDAPKGKRLVHKMTNPPKAKWSFGNPALPYVVAEDLPKDQEGFRVFPPKEKTGVHDAVRKTNEADVERCERKISLGRAGIFNENKTNIHPSWNEGGRQFVETADVMDWFDDYCNERSVVANTNPMGWTKRVGPYDDSHRPENIAAAEEKKRIAEAAKQKK